MSLRGSVLLPKQRQGKTCDLLKLDKTETKLDSQQRDKSMSAAQRFKPKLVQGCSDSGCEGKSMKSEGVREANAACM